MFRFTLCTLALEKLFSPTSACLVVYLVSSHCRSRKSSLQMFWSSSSKPTCHISCNTSPPLSTVFSAIFTGTLSPSRVHWHTHKASQNCPLPLEVLWVQRCACVNVRNALLLSTPPDPPAKFSKSVDWDPASWFQSYCANSGDSVLSMCSAMHGHA